MYVTFAFGGGVGPAEGVTMAKGRKARRNTLTRVAETGQRPAAAYRELRAANAPYEGYAIELFHVPGVLDDGGHRRDTWGYRVRDTDGKWLSWCDVNGPDHSHLTTRQACTLLGSNGTLEVSTLRARFPGARITEHERMPAECHCDWVACWPVHRGCTVACEDVRAGAERENQWTAEETYQAAYASWRAERKALEQRHDTEIQEIELAGQAVRERIDAWRARVDAGEFVPSTEALWRDDDAHRQREDDQRVRHRQEERDLDARQPELPAHWASALA
ncbi:hypothetical protein ACFVV7_26710 [Streptomyces globisporus]|uniref:hypothetical protein n=1 Tax=Streptomyces globisporus TaxID=1908 RepID=UPI0036DCB505